MSELREKIEEIISLTAGIGLCSSSEIADRILNDPIEDIEWVGECDKCKGEGEYMLSYPRPGGNPGYQNRTCEACNGTGKITRPATIEEVMEKVPLMLIALSEYSKMSSCDKTDCKKCQKMKEFPTINNGRLRIKERKE